MGEREAAAREGVRAFARASYLVRTAILDAVEEGHRRALGGRADTLVWALVRDLVLVIDRMEEGDVRAAADRLSNATVDVRGMRSWARREVAARALEGARQEIGAVIKAAASLKGGA